MTCGVELLDSNKNICAVKYLLNLHIDQILFTSNNIRYIKVMQT